MNEPLPIQQPHMIVVDPVLGQIIMHVESSGFSGALRFEPKVYDGIKSVETGPEFDTIAKIARLNICNIDTARILYATSFGLYQIMGYNLYGMGLHRSISDFLAGPNARILQDAMFAKFLAGRGINFTWKEMLVDPDKLNLFALHYNGSLAYGGRMKAIAKTLTEET
jgi:hypothetical protein